MIFERNDTSNVLPFEQIFLDSIRAFLTNRQLQGSFVMTGTASTFAIGNFLSALESISTTRCKQLLH